MSDLPPVSQRVQMDATDYKAGVAELNRQIRVLESGFRAAAASTADWDKNSSGLEARIKTLNGQITLQQQKVAGLKSVYAQLASSGKTSAKELEELQIKINKANEELNKNQLELAQSTTKLASLGNESKKAASEEEKATEKTKTFGTALQNLGHTLSSVGSGLKTVGSGLGSVVKTLGSAVSSIANHALTLAKNMALVGAAATAAVVGGLASTIGPASDLNETLNKSEVVFGKYSFWVSEWGKKSASAMGMSTNAAVGAAATYGNLFRSMGMTELASYSMSTGLVQLASDLASFNNLSPEDVLEKLRSGLTGETEPLKSLGVNINQAAIEAQAMKMGLMGANGVLTSAAKAQATYALILQQTSLAQGDFGRTSEGLANQQRIIAATFENLKARIGTGLLPALTSVTGAFTSWLNADETQKKINTLVDGIATVGKAFSEGMTFSKDGALGGRVFDGLINALYSLNLSGVADGLVGFGVSFDKFSGFISKNIGGVISSLSTLGTSGGGISQGLDALGGTLDRITGYLTSFFAIFQNSGGDAGKIGAGLGGLITQILGDTANARAGMVSFGLQILQGLMNGIVGALPTLLPAATQILTELVNMIVQAMPILLSSGTQILTGLINAIVTSLPMLVTAGMQILSGLVNAVLLNLPMLIQAALQLVITLALGIAQALPTMLPTLIQIIPQIIAMLIQSLPLLIQAALQIILALANGLVAALPTLIAAVPQILQGLIDALIIALPMLLTVAWQIITILVQGIIAALPALAQGVLQIINIIVQTFATLMPQVAKIGQNVVKGIWDGYMAMWKNFVADVSTKFQELWAKIKSLLGISSPSKVYASLGENMALGLGKGFTSAMAGVQSQIAASIAGINGAVSANVSLPNGPGGIAGSGAPTAAGNTYIFNFKDTTLNEAELTAILQRQELLYGA